MQISQVEDTCRSAAAFKLGRHKDAQDDAEKAIQLDPDFAKAYLRRATASSSLEDFEGALRDYEKVHSNIALRKHKTYFVFEVLQRRQ